MGIVHRPGPFAQPHKPFHTLGHKPKGLIKRQEKGRVTKQKTSAANSKYLRFLTKEQRREQLKHFKQNKNRAVAEAKRRLGGEEAPPVLATVISIGDTLSAKEFVERLAGSDDTLVRRSAPNAEYFTCPRFKSRMGFMTPATAWLDEVLDALKVCDILIMIWPVDGQIDEEFELLLTAMLAHGIPAVINVLPGLSTVKSGKQKENARARVKFLVEKWSMKTEKIAQCDSTSDALNLMRTVSECKKKKMQMQQKRSHMLVDRLDVEERNEDGGHCTLLATGYVRGPTWNVNRLVHVPGLGDFQVTRIVQHNDPNPLKPRQSGVFPEGGKLIAEADPEKQDSLQAEIIPDPMEGEQAMLDDDLKMTDDKLMFESKKKMVPKGTSSYQAAWIFEDEDGSEGEGDDASDEDEEGASLKNDVIEEEMDNEEDDAAIDDATTIATEGDVGFVDEIDMDEVEEYRREREDAQFPDEVDTPTDIPARVRFQKYRGMKSFRTSFWDYNENLPFNYARIFKFQNFQRTKKVVMRAVDQEIEGETAASGAFVTVYIKNVPISFTSSLREGAPLVLYSMLQHEQKMSTVNMVIRKHPDCKVPIPNKTPLIFYVGFRKYEAAPVFSQHTNGDKFKMERYLKDDPTVATVFAPITFPNVNVLVFRRTPKGVQQLVARGSVLDNNPDRVVLKRIVLSGQTYKINKRSATSRFMFFNREDIEWFKPVELHTPDGARGHIKMAIGTHGYMKMRFNKQPKQQANVMMALYKRVFPKWTYMPLLPANEQPITAVADEEEMCEQAEKIN